MSKARRTVILGMRVPIPFLRRGDTSECLSAVHVKPTGGKYSHPYSEPVGGQELQATTVDRPSRSAAAADAGRQQWAAFNAGPEDWDEEEFRPTCRRSDAAFTR